MTFTEEIVHQNANVKMEQNAIIMTVVAHVSQALTEHFVKMNAMVSGVKIVPMKSHAT